MWGSEIAGDAEFSVEIGRNVWRLSALLVLANCISGKVPQGRVRLISDGSATHQRRRISDAMPGKGDKCSSSQKLPIC